MDERRKYPRYKYTDTAPLVTGHECRRVRLQDLSVGGVCINSPVWITPDNTVKLFIFSTVTGNTLSLYATSCYCHQGRTGLKFEASDRNVNEIVALLHLRELAQKEYIRIMTAVIALLGALTILATGFTRTLDFSPATVVSDNMPIINQEARDNYAAGRISKDTAENMIDTQLSRLIDAGNIASWKYSASTGKYDITLLNGTHFTYYLK